MCRGIFGRCGKLAIGFDPWWRRGLAGWLGGAGLDSLSRRLFSRSFLGGFLSGRFLGGGFLGCCLLWCVRLALFRSFGGCFFGGRLLGRFIRRLGRWRGYFRGVL